MANVAQVAGDAAAAPPSSLVTFVVDEIHENRDKRTERLDQKEEKATKKRDREQANAAPVALVRQPLSPDELTRLSFPNNKAEGCRVLDSKCATMWPEKHFKGIAIIFFFCFVDSVYSLTRILFHGRRNYMRPRKIKHIPNMPPISSHHHNHPNALQV